MQFPMPGSPGLGPVHSPVGSYNAGVGGVAGPGVACGPGGGVAGGVVGGVGGIGGVGGVGNFNGNGAIAGAGGAAGIGGVGNFNGNGAIAGAGAVVAGAGGFVQPGGAPAGIVGVNGPIAEGQTSCAKATCMAMGCVGQSGPQAMSFVGSGQGEYISETTYKFVGQGQGNLERSTPTQWLYMRIGLSMLAIVLILGLVALVFLNPFSTATSTQLSQMGALSDEPAECTFWGDPHLRSFDGARPSFYGEGEFWIVKHAEVHIQGRYMGTEFTKGLASTNRIIIGGSFIGDHTITVGTMDSGDLLVDDKPVLTSFPSHFALPGGHGFLVYNDKGDLVDEATNIWERHVVTMHLPKRIMITVFRWDNYLDLRIKMSPLAGMDGSCGNFNGDPTDDDTRAIFSRIGARIAEGENMFHTRARVVFSDDEKKLLELCSPRRQATAGAKCREQLSKKATEDEVHSCMLDFCFGANEHMLKMTEALNI